MATPLASVTSLIPFVFSPDDEFNCVPRALVSAPTLQAHHYLSLSPADDRYWTCGNKDSQVVLARREIVESGALESVQLGSARYSYDAEGELKSLVPVSLPSNSSPTTTLPILDIVLLYEEESPPASSSSVPAQAQEPSRPGGREGEWKFLKLSAPSIVLPNDGFNALRQGGNSSSFGRRTSVVEGQWFESIEEAVEAVQGKGRNEVETTTTRTRPPPGLDFDSIHGDVQDEQDEYDEYGTRRKRGNPSKMKTREEMAEGEGTTPGAYGDSNDFWAGWSDSEDEVDSGVGFVVNDTRGRDTEKDDEEDYWKGYGEVTNQVDDGRREEEVVQESPVIGYEPATKAAPPIVDSPTKVKTRSRRSSTVTPFKLSTLPSSSSPSSPSVPTTVDNNVEDTPSASSFLTFDSPAQPSTTFPPPSETSSSSAPPLASAVKLASVIQDSSQTNEPSSEAGDENLRFALAGIWGLYKGPIEGREERRKRFERIAGEVLRS